MSKQYLTERQLEVVMNLKVKGATFDFHELENGKHMLVALLKTGEQRPLVAVDSCNLYPFKETLDSI